MRFGLLAVIGAALTFSASVSFAAEKKYDADPAKGVNDRSCALCVNAKDGTAPR
jgi:hypothetical protein